jgi:hypothetical protein
MKGSNVSRKKYIVAPGFVVAGRGEGSVLTAKDVENLDAMLASGRLIPEPVRASSTMKDANRNDSEEGR